MVLFRDKMDRKGGTLQSMKILDTFKKFMETVIVLVMIAMVLVIFFATVGRYTGLFSIPWSEEFARYSMIAMTYLGAMIAASRGSHFAVEVVGMVFPKKVQNIITVVNIIVVDLFSVFILKQGWQISNKMLTQGKLSPMLEWPLGLVYMLIPVGLVLMAIYFTAFNINKIRTKEEK